MLYRRTHPLALFTAAVATVVALGACRDPLPPPVIVTDGVIGEYVLRTFNGFEIPQIVSESEDTVASITGGMVVLYEDSTFLDSTDYQFIINGALRDSFDVARGFFRTTDDNRVIFYSGSLAWEMTHDDNLLTQDTPLGVLVYRK